MLAPGEDNEPLYLGYYKIEKTLGQGSYGKVKLATNVRNGQKYALKFIEKANIKKPVHMTRIKREVRLLKLLNHQGIVKLYEVAETENEIILTMEYASGGELFDYIVAQNRLREKDARRLFRQIVSAVDYCHQHCVIHRDLKPENLLLDENLNIKIIDFGFSNMFDPSALMGTFCGSPFYASPEMILGKKYTGPEVDVWSLGVILFALVTGHLPFDDTNMKRLYNKIITGDFNFPAYLTEDCKDLIKQMITVDPLQRSTLDMIKQHPWMMEGYDTILEIASLSRPPIQKLDEKIFNRLASYGFDLEDCRMKLLQVEMNPAKATYYLLKERVEREEQNRLIAHRDALSKMSALATISEEIPQIPVPTLTNVHTPQSFAGLSATEIEEMHKANQIRRQRAVTLNGNDAQRLKDAATAIRVMMSNMKKMEYTPELNLPSLPAFPNAESMAPKERNIPLSIKTATPYDLMDTFTEPDTSSRTTPIVSTNRRFRSVDQGTASKMATTVAARLKKKFFSPESARVASKTDRASMQINAATAGLEEMNMKGSYAEGLREVKGLFNVATSSTKSPEEILAEVTRVLNENHIEFSFHSHTFRCKNAGSTNSSDHIEFEIELCRIKNLGLYGLHLVRLSGDTWPYKRLCHRLTSMLRL